MTVIEYNECVRKYADGVFRFIFKNLQQKEDARDIVQSSFEKMWLHREEVISEQSKTYLFTVAYRQMIDHIRKNKRVVYQEEFCSISSGSSEQKQNTRRLLQEALSKLNETQRCLVMLKDYEGYNYKEIAEIMNLNETQVKVYLHRARLQLKAYIVKFENVI